MTHRVDASVSAPVKPFSDDLAAARDIADGLRTLIAIAEIKGLPAVALSLRLILADLLADTTGPE